LKKKLAQAEDELKVATDEFNRLQQQKKVWGEHVIAAAKWEGAGKSDHNKPDFSLEFARDREEVLIKECDQQLLLLTSLRSSKDEQAKLVMEQAKLVDNEKTRRNSREVALLQFETSKVRSEKKFKERRSFDGNLLYSLLCAEIANSTTERMEVHQHKRLRQALKGRTEQELLEFTPEVIQLAGRLNESEQFSDCLVLRKCFVQFFQIVREFAYTSEGERLKLIPPNQKRTLLLGGTRGIGKSVLGTLAAVVFASCGQIVLYELKGRYYILHSKEAPGEQSEQVNLILKDHGFPQLDMNEPQVLEMDDKSLFSSLAEAPLLTIHDLADRESPLFLSKIGLHLHGAAC
jgi:hypothetical protein